MVGFASLYPPYAAVHVVRSQVAPVRLDVERIEGMRRRHIEAVALRPAEGQVRAALRQADEADRLALRIEHHHAVEIFGLALQLIDLVAVDLGRLRPQRAV